MRKKMIKEGKREMGRAEREKERERMRDRERRRERGTVFNPSKWVFLSLTLSTTLCFFVVISEIPSPMRVK